MAGPYTIPTAVPGAGDPPAEFNTLRAAVLDIYAERAGGVFFEATTTFSGTITQNGFETYPIDNPITNIGGGSFNTGTYIYTIPSTGLYDCQATIRIQDSNPARSLGVGIGLTNADGPHFLWGNMGGVNRDARQYRRLTRFTAADQVRLYIYSDGTSFPVNSGNLVIMRVGE